MTKTQMKKSREDKVDALLPNIKELLSDLDASMDEFEGNKMVLEGIRDDIDNILEMSPDTMVKEEPSLYRVDEAEFYSEQMLAEAHHIKDVQKELHKKIKSLKKLTKNWKKELITLLNTMPNICRPLDHYLKGVM